MPTSVVNFKCIGYAGKIGNVKIPIEHPEFEDENFTFAGKEFVEKKEAKLSDYLDSMDKRPIMDKNDMYVILDYYVVPDKKPTKKKPVKQVDKTELFISYMNMHALSEQSKLDVLVCFKQQYEHIKNLSLKKQLLICVESAIIGHKAILENYKKMDWLRDTTKKALKAEGIHSNNAYYLEYYADQLRIEAENYHTKTEE